MPRHVADDSLAVTLIEGRTYLVVFFFGTWLVGPVSGMREGAANIYIKAEEGALELIIKDPPCHDHYHYECGIVCKICVKSFLPPLYVEVLPQA
jgi:hypothetical protein